MIRIYFPYPILYPTRSPIRAFDMRFMDGFHKEVIHFSRPFACSCFNCCCLSVMTVEAPVGKPIGVIRQMPGTCKVRFQVTMGQNNQEYRLGPLAPPFARSLAPLTYSLAHSLCSPPRSWGSE